MMILTPQSALFDALQNLSLVNLDGSTPATGVLDAPETVVFLVRRAMDSSFALTIEAQGAIFEANALAEAAAAEGRPIDIVIVPVFDKNFSDGAGADVADLVAGEVDAGVRVLRLASTELSDLDGNSTAAGEAVNTLAQAFFDAAGADFSDAGNFALHHAPGTSELTPVVYAEPVPLGGSRADDRVSILDDALEAQLAATGPALDLPEASLPIPLATGAVGAYDEVGEFMPNLVFTDANGDAFELLDQTDRLLVVSVCAEWCTPCFRYSRELDDIASEAGTDFSFVEVLVENNETGLSRTIDAAEWTNRFHLETPVATVNGDRAFYLDFTRGAFVDAIPLYLVIDGTTGEIVGRFNAFFDQDTLLDQLFDIADGYLGVQPGQLIEGNDRSNVLQGTRFDDTLIGHGGNDELRGGRGNDRLDGGAGRDLLLGGGGDDTYVIADGRLDLDFIIDSGGSDTLEITGTQNGSGRVNVNLGFPGGIDRVVIAEAAGPVTFRGGSSSPADLNFRFFIDTDSASRFVGISGGAFDDRIFVDITTPDSFPSAALALLSDPTPGPFTVTGGAGDDNIFVVLNDLAYAIYGGIGNDRIEVASPEAQGATLSGGVGDDALIGSQGADTLNGGAGDDTLAGGFGDDTLIGGAGADRLDGGDGDDTYVVADAGDTIREAGAGIHIANADFDHFFAFYGIDMDTFLDHFGNVNPTQNAFVPFDTVGSDLFGASYDEVRDLFVDVFFGLIPFEFLPDNSVFVGTFATGIDTVKSSVSFDFDDVTRVFGVLENLVLTGSGDINGFGNDSANRITGNSGDNALLGRGGEDRLNGGDGDDVLAGGRGRDVLFGGAGNDTFKYFSRFDSGTTTASRDIIKDFETGDTIDLSDISGETGGALQFIDGAAFSSEAGEVRQFAQGGNTILAADLDGDGFGDFQIAVAGAVTFDETNLVLAALI